MKGPPDRSPQSAAARTISSGDSRGASSRTATDRRRSASDITASSHARTTPVTAIVTMNNPAASATDRCRRKRIVRINSRSR